MADPEIMKENAEALEKMTKEQEAFMQETFHLSKQDMISLDEMDGRSFWTGCLTLRSRMKTVPAQRQRNMTALCQRSLR